MKQTPITKKETINKRLIEKYLTEQAAQRKAKEAAERKEREDISAGRQRQLDYYNQRNTGAVDLSDEPDDTNNAAGMEAKGRFSTVLAVITALTIFYFLLPILFEK